MEKIIRTLKVLKFVLFGLVLVNLLFLFSPMYTVTANNTSTILYLYQNVNVFVFLLFAACSCVFLLVKFNNAKLCAYVSIACLLIYNGVCYLLMSNAVMALEKNAVTYNSIQFFFYFTLFTSLVLLVSIGFYVAYKIYGAQIAAEEAAEAQEIEVEEFKNKIETLEELRKENLLTEPEYQIKRDEIVKGLRL